MKVIIEIKFRNLNYFIITKKEKIKKKLILLDL
jgi:hypothetical protein